eukprot:156129_1
MSHAVNEEKGRLFTVLQLSVAYELFQYVKLNIDLLPSQYLEKLCQTIAALKAKNKNDEPIKMLTIQMPTPAATEILTPLPRDEFDIHAKLQNIHSLAKAQKQTDCDVSINAVEVAMTMSIHKKTLNIMQELHKTILWQSHKAKLFTVLQLSLAYELYQYVKVNTDLQPFQYRKKLCKEITALKSKNNKVGSMESSMISWQRIPWSASSWRRVA